MQPIRLTILALAAAATLCPAGPDENTRRIAALVERFCNGDVAERAAARKALLQAGRVAWPHFRRLLHKDDPDIRRRARLIWTEIVIGGNKGWATPGRETAYDPQFGLPTRVFDKKSGAEMALVVPGRTRVADRWVQVTVPFYMSVYEITEAQYGRVHPDVLYLQTKERGRRPIAGVDLAQIQKFLKVAGLDLPTGAEWEYAYYAGGVQSEPRPVPDPPRKPRAAPTAGRERFNGLGFCDMRGNLAERCGDGFARGGNTADPAAKKEPLKAGTKHWLLGFRAVRRLSRTEYGR